MKNRREGKMFRRDTEDCYEILEMLCCMFSSNYISLVDDVLNTQ